MQKIYPAPGPAPAEPLAELYAYPENLGQAGSWVRANMVASADGAAELDGRTGELGGPADRMLFQLLRGLADVILVGAGTVRAEGYGPARPGNMPAAVRAGRPATPPIAVVTASLNLDPECPLLAGAPPDARTIVLTTATAPAARRAAIARHADVIVAGASQVSAGDAVKALAGRGHSRILTEGGPILLAQIAAEGLLDELCLTISPVLAGGPGGRVLASGPPGQLPGAPERLRLAHVLTDNGYLFCRYLRDRT